MGRRVVNCSMFGTRSSVRVFQHVPMAVSAQWLHGSRLGILDTCVARDVGVVLGGAYNSGILATGAVAGRDTSDCQFRKEKKQLLNMIGNPV